MKRIITLLIVLAMLVSFGGCWPWWDRGGGNSGGGGYDRGGGHDRGAGHGGHH